MKLSNKILIGFFGFVFFYMTAAFTEIRLKGSYTLMDDSNSIAEAADIPGVSYLVLENLGKNIRVVGSDKARLEVRSTTGDLLRNLKYEMSGDTLTLKQFNIEENQLARITIYIPKGNPVGMTVNGAVVDVESLEQNSLYILQNDGIINVADNKLIGNLHLEASNGAIFNTSGMNLDTLSLQIHNSRVTINSPVDVLEGSMTNNAYLYVPGTNEIKFKKDDSSKLYIE